MNVCGCGRVGSGQVSDPAKQQKQGLATGSLQVSLKGHNNVAREEKRQHLPPVASYQTNTQYQPKSFHVSFFFF